MKGLARARAIDFAPLAAVVVALVAVACGKGNDAGGRGSASGACTCDGAGERPVDRALVAWLSKARSAHHLADLAEAENAPAKAVAALDPLVAPASWSGAPPAEVDEVIADTRARLAELRSQAGDFDAAERDLEDGLARAKGATYFRGHLLEVRGLVEERRAKALDAKGDAAGAARARDEATKASLEAISIQEKVIQRALADGGTR